MDHQVLHLASGTTRSLESLRSETLVVEFWNTRCERCPAALHRLNEMAASAPSTTTVVACALATSTDTSAELDKVKALVCVDDVEAAVAPLPHLGHVFMTWHEKERLKKSLGFSTVPHCVVYERQGTVVALGPPDNKDVQRVLADVLTPWR